MMRDEKNNVAEFRFVALEQEFVRTMTNVCDIFKLYGESKIEEHYDIRQQLETLKIPNWHHITPYRCFLEPLEDSLNSVREELATMQKKGPLLIKYQIEENEELRQRVKDMLQKDWKAQLLMGDQLK